jgi:hypothetical protein
LPARAVIAPAFSSLSGLGVPCCHTVKEGVREMGFWNTFFNWRTSHHTKNISHNTRETARQVNKHRQEDSIRGLEKRLWEQEAWRQRDEGLDRQAQMQESLRRASLTEEERAWEDHHAERRAQLERAEEQRQLDERQQLQAWLAAQKALPARQRHPDYVKVSHRFRMARAAEQRAEGRQALAQFRQEWAQVKADGQARRFAQQDAADQRHLTKRGRNKAQKKRYEKRLVKGQLQRPPL